MNTADAVELPHQGARPPEGPSSLPLIGDALPLLRDPLGYLIKVRETYGPVAEIKLGPKRVMLVQSPEGVKQILWAKGKQYPKPDLGMDAIAPLLGKNSIATLTNTDEWANARSFILPLFSAKMLQAYFQEAVSSIQEEVEALEKIAGSEEAINIYDWMHEATLRILLRTVFRTGLGRDEIPELTQLFNEATAYINVRYTTLGLPIDWAIGSARRGKKALERLNARVYQLIRDRRAETNSSQSDMLDVLLAAKNEDGSPLSDEQIRDNCMTMLFGGHETTAGSVTWAWGLLSAHPEVRETLLHEVDTVLSAGPPESYGALKALQYTSMVFEEAMRLYPMFAFLFREAAEDDVIEGCTIRKGDLVAFSAHTIHHDGAVWPNPERFLPDRHTAEAKAARQKGEYLPFSLGQRGCIGERMARMEAILLLALISQKFEFDLVGELPHPKVSMSLKPEGGMWMHVKKRSIAGNAA